MDNAVTSFSILLSLRRSPSLFILREYPIFATELYYFINHKDSEE